MTDDGATDDGDTVCVAADGLTIEIDIAAAARALEPSLAEVIVTAVQAARDMAGAPQGCVTVLVADDERLRALNRTWRSLDQPTNVLAFPGPAGPDGPERYLGDIAISYETATREAVAEHKSLPQHVAHLSVHGFLHLLGYDHVADDQADEMEQLERAVLARLGLPDPYVAQEPGG